METMLENVKQYLNVWHNEDDKLITSLINMSKAYICSYTGRDMAWVEENPTISDFLIMQVVATMYESRGLDSQQVKENMMLKSMLNLYSINQM